MCFGSTGCNLSYIKGKMLFGLVPSNNSFKRTYPTESKQLVNCLFWLVLIF